MVKSYDAIVFKVFFGFVYFFIFEGFPFFNFNSFAIFFDIVKSIGFGDCLRNPSAGFEFVFALIGFATYKKKNPD